MRWLQWSLLALTLSGCSVHVVQQPAAVTSVAATPGRTIWVEGQPRSQARPAGVASVHPEYRPTPTRIKQPRKLRPERVASTRPEPRPNHVAGRRAQPVKPGRAARPAAAEQPVPRLRKPESDDFPAIETGPADADGRTRPASTDIAQAQKHPFNLQK